MWLFPADLPCGKPGDLSDHALENIKRSPGGNWAPKMKAVCITRAAEQHHV